jgi:hypothetical protein
MPSENEVRLVDGIFIGVRLSAVGLVNGEGEEIYNEDIDPVLTEDLETVLYEFDHTIDYLRQSDEDLSALAYNLGEHIAERIADSLVAMREVLREADDIAYLVERLVDGEQDWEV